MSKERRELRPYTKIQLLEYLKKVPDDEPLFLLRAQDDLAPSAIIRWIERAVEEGVSDKKVFSAETHLHDFGTFQRIFPERVKLPD